MSQPGEGMRKEPMLRWDRPKCDRYGENPSARSGHSFCIVSVVPGKDQESRPFGYLFGGVKAKSKPPGPCNELYKLDVDEMKWENLGRVGAVKERWQHTATPWKSSMIVFGGIGPPKPDPLSRNATPKFFNDVWLLDTATDSWGAMGPGAKWPNCPLPRGSHAACVVDGDSPHPQYCVFGGYGGAKGSRRDFDDLSMLDLNTWRWETVESAGGASPERRSGHQLVATPGKLYVFGGWNAERQFSDVLVFDLATDTWSNLPPPPLAGPLAGGCPWGAKRWKHAAVAALGVPHFKVFVFGGNSGDLEEPAEEGGEMGTYLNDTLVLDAGSEQWSLPLFAGEPPSPRADSPFAFDGESQKMYCFGGWANKWFDDFVACDLSEVAGPPYHVVSMSPVIGPITGRTVATIRGRGFESGGGKKGKITVRFACEKGFQDETGRFVSDTEIECDTPNWERFGPVDVEVRVSIGRRLFTDATLSYSFFSVGDASQTFAFGVGLTEGCATGYQVSFIIDSRDHHGRKRVCGMDEFEVDIQDIGEPEEEFEDEEEAGPAEEGGGAAGEVEEEAFEEEDPFEIDVLDQMDGTYLVTYIPQRQTKYQISVLSKGSFEGKAGPVRGSPFVFSTVYGDEELNVMNGSLVLKSTKTTIAQIKEECDGFLTVMLKKATTDDRDSLIAIKDTLSQLERRSEELSLAIDSSKAMLSYLKSKDDTNLGLEKLLRDLEASESLFQEALAKAPNTADRIIPVTHTWANKTEVEVGKYTKKLQFMEMDFRARPMWEYETGAEAARQDMKGAKSELKREAALLEDMAHLCETFEYPGLIDEARAFLDQMSEYLKQMDKLWRVTEDLDLHIKRCRNLKWSTLDLDALEEGTKKQAKAVKQQVPKGVRFCKAYQTITKMINDFLNTVPLIQMMAAKCMHPRHWDNIKDATGFNFKAPHEDEDMLLGDLINLRLHEHMADVEEICDRAVKEDKMEKQLADLDRRWGEIEFLASMYKDTDIPLLAVKEEDFEALEGDQLTVQGMLASRHVGHFETQVQQWQHSLASISDVYTFVTEIQRTWSYLEPLFVGSEEVKKELPEDAERFKGIDVDVKSMLKEMWHVCNIKAACNEHGLSARCEGILELLGICKKSLADFLDGRRRQFPRYYFTSEADLLDILSNGSQPKKILHHTPKVYLQTKTFRLSDDDHVTETGRPVALGWTAGVGIEEVDFEPPVAMEGKVEIYMQTLLDACKVSLFQNLKRSLVRYAEYPRKDWVMFKNSDLTKNRPADPAQIILLVLAVFYVQEVEDAFVALEENPEAMKEYSQKQISQLSELIILTQSKITKPERQRIMACITMDAHSRDVIQKTILYGYDDVNCFWWQSQLKHKFRDPPPQASFTHRDPHLRGENGERAEIAICDAILPYDYEYLGNGFRLVITPLTDRIYVTATQALNLKMGCAPAGPAGTGKTETTKDLSSALAKCVYVVNCSPEMDYKGLGNIFKGVASSGAWICFDEFNRLVPEVLSVCTVQFKSVCDGCKAETDNVVIEGDRVTLDATCGAFITMNPGYLGRSELPEGLKALFRPITVMVPDLVLICENFLMAEGFIEAKTLASKFYGLYSLLGALLSKQLHYDWGLRAVKSVLVVAGSFKRAEPGIAEEALLMRALRDFNIPKIVQEDEVIFFGLLGDLFPFCENQPRTNPPRKVNEELEDFVKRACERLGNCPDPDFMLKCVQFEELLAIRHCVFLMGPAAAGKTQCWKTLAAARGLRGDTTKAFDINPKSVTTKELYGYISMASREWKDGLLSSIMRSVGEINNEDPKWIMLDGDLDANWIESMNSVMDDNRMLTLASNERIPLKTHMRMVFEIRDLKYATPATVSRAGILYISTASGSQWRSLISSWLNQDRDGDEYSDEAKEVLRHCFDTYIAATLFWMKVNVSCAVPLQDMTLVQTLLFMLDGTLTEHARETPESIETVFSYCAVWAVGSCLTIADDGADHRSKFSEWWRSEWKTVQYPNNLLVFDYWLNLKEMQFDNWTESPYFFEIDYDSRKTAMQSVTVPTPDSCSVTFWMTSLVNMQRAVMLAGPAGTGKTQMVMGMLTKLNPDEKVFQDINFNFYTTSQVLQTTMCLPLEKKTGTTFGPPGNRKLVYFVDDLNLPEVDKYNTQSAIALLRQQMEYEHVYDLAKLSTNPLKFIKSTQMIACLNPTAGSFEIDPRLQRWFATFAISLPGPTSLLIIYQTFLKGHLQHNGFTDDVVNLVNAIIKGALGLHAAVSGRFRKTAANFHYEFNIRHIANVFQGLLVAQPKEFKSPEKMVQLWLHESERVYGDRLVSPEDLTAYYDIASSQSSKCFSFSVARFFAPENADPLVFCHFADGIGDGDKVYNQIENLTHMSDILVGALHEYNETNAAMDLVLFDDAMKHVARISRIVLNEGGHALCVGVGGSGKQSLSRLAAFICDYTVKQIVISSTYSINDLKDDLKVMYNQAGIKDEGVMFLLTDSQIVNERFLIFINDLLASGNIPDLYATDEVDAITGNGKILSAVKAAGLLIDKKNCWDYFIGRIRTNLHVVLAFSPVGDDFRTRARKFPALVNCTVIDWFQPWPENALFRVGQKFMASVELGESSVRDGVEAFLPYSFLRVNEEAKEFHRIERRFVYTTPKSFLELLKLYSGLLGEKFKQADFAIDRLANGLQKLKETAESVVRIEENLKVDLEAAAEKKMNAEGIAEVVTKERAVVEVETEKGEKEAVRVGAIQKDVAAQAKSTQADLDAATPAVNKAMAALKGLDAKQISEVKGSKAVPSGVGEVFGATMCLLAGVLDTIKHKNNVCKGVDQWDVVKKQCLVDVKKYMEKLLELKTWIDESRFPPVNIVQAKKLSTLEVFDPEIIKGKNSAAAGLCEYVINIITYHDIVVDVEPKRRALRRAQDTLRKANKELATVQKKVADLQAKLAKLTAELQSAETDKKEAQDTVERGQRKLDLANRLTSALEAENQRWAVNIDKLIENKAKLIGDVLLASAFISYVGPFTKPFRDSLMVGAFTPFLQKAFEKATVSPLSDESNPLLILTNEAEMAQWQTDFLPADRVSMENGAVVCNSSRWPLVIDPQLQGIRWLRAKEGQPERHLQIVRLSQKDVIRKLTGALENGHSLIIENLGETLDAVLNPVIQRATIKKGRTMYVKLGDAEVEFHPDFRLFLHTKLSNPHYPPEIQAETTLVNFTVTRAGLEDQILVLVVRKQRKDLADLSEDLVRKQNGFKIKMTELEDSILTRLAHAEGDLTEDIDLIEGLESTKKISVEIEKKSEAAHKTQGEIHITSEKYRPVANRSALLFFLMNDLVKMHTYYIYSLSAFTSVFYRGIDKVMDEIQRAMRSNRPSVEGDPDGVEMGEEGGPNLEEGEVDEEDMHANDLTDAELEERCRLLIESITITVFEYIRRGLFVRDKLTVAALFSLSILVNDKKLQQEDVDYLVAGKIAPEPGDMGMDLATWMPDATWPKVKALEDMKRFKSIGNDMRDDSEEWLLWFDAAEPENTKMPGDYGKRCSVFEKLIILRALRPDRVTEALRTWIVSVMGAPFVEQPTFSMEQAYSESNPQTPVFFVLFAGVDPTPWVEGLGKELGITEEAGTFRNISMGQGQEKPAEAVVSAFAKTGGWVMLQNCHLMQSWVPQLERLLEIVSEDAHDNFRCFISAEPPPLAYMRNMPESLMQSCIKVANEAPADIRSNLRKAWTSFGQAAIDDSTKPNELKGCVFALCWFHSIVLGRRRFGQQGWSRKYSFNTGDLEICIRVTNSYLEANTMVPWDDLRYLFGEIFYGGHITDAWDRRTANTYLEVLFTKGIFEQCELGPGFNNPVPEGRDYEAYDAYVVEHLPPESPPQFGLHPNAEIGYLENATLQCFNDILNIGGGSSSGGGDGDDGSGGGGFVKNILDDLLSRLPEDFVMVIILEKAKPLLEDLIKSPFVVVALQECTRMNTLLSEIRRTLVELDKGLQGQLNMSDSMEDLVKAFTINQWPGRNPFSKCTWEKLAWPSMKNLVFQFSDMLKRVTQLVLWTETLDRPRCLWLPGLFSPSAYLTAILQTTGRMTGWALDKMTTETHITTISEPQGPSLVKTQPENGVYVHGLFLEGARWPVGDEVEEKTILGGAEVGGALMDGRLKELLPQLPIVYIRACEVEPSWEASGVGYLRHVDGIYECPVYFTTFRGPTYVFLATLQTVDPKSKWVLAGTAVIMQTNDA